MTAILHQLPFSERSEEAAVGTERVRVRPYQILVWVSLSLKSVLELPPNASRFPAILDTGHNHNLSIRHQHLVRWAGIDPAQVPQLGNVREGGRRAALHALNAWLHPNEPGQRDRLADRPAYCLELPQGVTVYPDEANFPRLPLLGLRALVHNRLHLVLDPERCLVNLRTSDWRTKLLQWLS